MRKKLAHVLLKVNRLEVIGVSLIYNYPPERNIGYFKKLCYKNHVDGKTFWAKNNRWSLNTRTFLWEKCSVTTNRFRDRSVSKNLRQLSFFLRKCNYWPKRAYMAFSLCSKPPNSSDKSVNNRGLNVLKVTCSMKLFLPFRRFANQIYFWTVGSISNAYEQFFFPPYSKFWIRGKFSQRRKYRNDWSSSGSFFHKHFAA